ncbi:MAG: UDP-N-acetylglucosamine 4,6-dehydratase [Flavobacteriaceae bacterium]|nr:UDP-N-acetylglucosamine 4,6-dehydratase [Flavobacteriaceae bacterium]
MNVLNLIGRNKLLFSDDVLASGIDEVIASSSFLVVGGAGTIGQSVVKELFKRTPKKLHVVDLSENNLVELVRDIRSSLGYIKGDFRTFALDCASLEFKILFNDEGPYDYVLNLSALKHVRSEKDKYTLMRMVDVNILNTIFLLDLCIQHSVKAFFCVSTDKATNPVNMMGASKRIMELFVMNKSADVKVSMARFANVAFSDGSLLHGFSMRMAKKQPVSAPTDIRRYFITPQEAGELCLLSCIEGDNRDIFFPKLNAELDLLSFSDIGINYLKFHSYKPKIFSNEEEARAGVKCIKEGFWPCYFFKSDTTGEKGFEEFFLENDAITLENYNKIGIIKNEWPDDEALLSSFLSEISRMKLTGHWNREIIIDLFSKMVPNFSHSEKGKYLDSKM